MHQLGTKVQRLFWQSFVSLILFCIVRELRSSVTFPIMKTDAVQIQKKGNHWPGQRTSASNATQCLTKWRGKLPHYPLLTSLSEPLLLLNFNDYLELDSFKATDTQSEIVHTKGSLTLRKGFRTTKSIIKRTTQLSCRQLFVLCNVSFAFSENVHRWIITNSHQLLQFFSSCYYSTTELLNLYLFCTSFYCPLISSNFSMSPPHCLWF
jgi:hypothetical protein